MRKITHLILHCSGEDTSTVKSMRWYHTAIKGWADVAYHLIGYVDGSVHPGRAERKPGAGVTGMNTTTLHYCLVGDLDSHAPDPTQYFSAVCYFAAWCKKYHLDPEVAILGHRETGSFVPKILRTKKQCPGKFVDMRLFRRDVKAVLHETP